jgi:hypothetical protein
VQDDFVGRSAAVDAVCSDRWAQAPADIASARTASETTITRDIMLTGRSAADGAARPDDAILVRKFGFL